MIVDITIGLDFISKYVLFLNQCIFLVKNNHNASSN
jgi:hypothetical protein